MHLPHQLELVACAPDIVQPDYRRHCLALREVIAKRRQRAIGLLDQVLGLEPPAQKRAQRVRRACVTIVPPGRNVVANVRNQRGQ